VTKSDPRQIPIQPVDNPIICNPYEEPTQHWVYDTVTGEAEKLRRRRPASYWYKTKKVGTEQQQFSFIAEEQRDDLPLINALRKDVAHWRKLKYEGATTVTKELLRFWAREDRWRRLFFCQMEAIETIIYLAEIRMGGKKPRFTPAFTGEDLEKLVDTPSDAGLIPLTRFGCKMATGAGKTVVMAMLIAWAFCNRGKVSSDERFPSAVLVVCPNLTIKERLQVLRPDNKDNYYAEFDLVPTTMRPLMQSGKVLVTNWHQFAPESEHVEGGKSYQVVDKGSEDPNTFARRFLGELHDRAPLMVLNDEGHHAYRPAPLADKLTGDEAKTVKSDREIATVWVSGLDKINLGCGIRFCVDLSATPFYITGSGYIEGAPFPWLVSDFGLVDAIESGIVKIPRLPVSDTTGRPEPKYFKLWQHITDSLEPGERLPGRQGRPKPEVVYREAEPALNTLASQWVERFHYIQEASDEKDKVPPVLIIVCDNTDIAEVFYRNISGEETVEVVDDSDTDKDDQNQMPRGRKKKKKTKTVYGTGRIFPEFFCNSPERRYTLRIDTKLLAAAESEDPNVNKQAVAEELRKIVSTVGKQGEPGEHIRCVVSVAMLNEGWDANNVTHALGVRAFTSQLLCEQVVGRGLRRMDYTPDPETGLLAEEYVDVYGIPFSVIPFKGRPTKKKAPEDKPKNHVRFLEERANYEIRFPVVEGFAFALRKNLIKADIGKMEPLILEPNTEPTAVFVKPTVGYQVGPPSALGPGEFAEQNREEYYHSIHTQTIIFEIARQVVWALVGDDKTSPDPKSNPKLRLQSRHQLFPQVLSLAQEYVERKVDWRGCNRCELGHEKYVQRLVERLIVAIEPDDVAGEQPLMPILNRYKPIGTTGEVDFKTTRRCHGTQKSHINQVVLDTARWEASATFHLEQSKQVAFYARNDHLGLVIPYEYFGISHGYEPDFLVRMKDGRTLILEIKGYETDEEKAKHAAAKRWISAVNNWGNLGGWCFHVCRDPQLLGKELEHI